MAHTGRFGIALLLTASAAFGYDTTMDRRAIEEAIVIGQSRIESVRVRFHQPYRIAVGRVPVDYIEVITPFRRVEVEAETKARSGNRTLSQREALDVLGAAPDQIDFFVEMTFHPLNTYVGMPPYEVYLVLSGSGGARIDPRAIELHPRYGPRVGGLPIPTVGAPAASRGSEPVTGGTVVAHFDTRPLNATGGYDLVIGEAGKEIARARIDFRALR